MDKVTFPASCLSSGRQKFFHDYQTSLPPLQWFPSLWSFRALFLNSWGCTSDGFLSILMVIIIKSYLMIVTLIYFSDARCFDKECRWSFGFSIIFLSSLFDSLLIAWFELEQFSLSWHAERLSRGAFKDFI